MTQVSTPLTFTAQIETVTTIDPQHVTQPLEQLNDRDNRLILDRDVTSRDRRSSSSSNPGSGSVLTSGSLALNNRRLLGDKNSPEILNNIVYLTQAALHLDPLEDAEQWNAVVDALFTSACGGNGMNEREALRAENLLFNMYIGKAECSDPIKMQTAFQEKGLHLFELVEKQNELNPDPDQQWDIPAKLLIIAGFQKPHEEDHRPDIAEKLNLKLNFSSILENNIAVANEEENSQLVENRQASLTTTAYKELFLPNRFIHGAELDLFKEKLNSERVSNKIIFHDARKLEINSSGGNFEIVNHELTTSGFSNASPDDYKANFAPILLNDHWYLFGTYYDQNNIKSALVFDSRSSINHDIKDEYIYKLVEECNVEGDFHVISKEMQDNAPNACGLFVAKAMQQLEEADNGNYFETLENWSNEFESKSGEYQGLYNRRGRAELLNTLSDVISQENAA